MKKFFVYLMAVVAMAVYSVSASAQNTLVATLTHGGEISMFYGVNALRNAHDAAQHGDVINLSGGAFERIDIKKAVSIRGAGANGDNPTSIKGDFSIEIPAEVTERFSLEGCRVLNKMYIRGTLTNAYFLKDSISIIDCIGETKMINGKFVNCKVREMRHNKASKTLFVNCFVTSFSNEEGTVSNVSFVNCVIRESISSLHSCQFANSIIYGASWPCLPSTSAAVNCVGINSDNNMFKDLSSKTGCSIAKLDIFIDSNPENDLTPEAKDTYLGTDGTPVGMYGGSLPFDWTPTYPQITKMNVASKTTADGKLSVEIEVSAAQ